MQAKLDCNQFTGRKRDICRGHDDAGNPVLTPEKCEAYRRYWAGLPAVPADDACTHRGEKIGEEPCKLCGGRERMEPVYLCAIYGRCTARRYTRKQANRQAIERGDLPAVCYNCEHQEASDNKNV